MSNTFRVLVIGDIVGRPGRVAAKKLVPILRNSKQIDFVIANGENAAGGKGLTCETAKDIFNAGVDVITMGNHVFDNKDIMRVISDDPRIIRPANYPDGVGVPGCGWGIFDLPDLGLSVGVINLLGRVHMTPMDCPFLAGKRAAAQIRQHTPIIFADFHAEATSEKVAMGWHLDGQTTCVFGTHTHIPTADERLLHHGTAYITDIGMTGGYDGVIGVKFETVIDKFLRGMPVRHEVCEENIQLSGIVVSVDPASGRATAIERVMEKL